jgi:Protein of unknown function (DUF2971)
MAVRIGKDGIQRPGVPKVDTRLKEEDVLWRYLDTAKFFDFIHGSKLYFTRGDQFEDKFEGTFTHSVKRAIVDSYRVNKINCTYSKFKSRLREKIFLNCWHASSDDSMAMWKIYGQSDTAVAITTTIGKLTQAIQAANLPNYIYLKKVDYIKHWRDPSINVNPYSNVFSYKVKAYDYEKEVRVIVDRFEDGNFEERIEEKGMPVTVSQNDLLRSIVIGPTAPKWFLFLVRKMVSERGINVDVNRSKLWFKPV